MAKVATHFSHPIDYTGQYRGFWAGYKFKETLEYDPSGRHTGVDYNWGGGNEDLGHEIRSIADGIVRWTGSNPASGFGNVTIIEHPLSDALKKELGCDSLFSRYMHQNTIDVSAGQNVAIGQRIGTVGNTGTQWAHLHIDLYKSTIEGGGVHFRYDSHTQLMSYLDTWEFIESHKTAPVVKPQLLPTQAMLRSDDSTYLRKTPYILPDNIVKELPADYGYVDCLAIVHGGAVNGSDLWVRTWSNNYIHSSRLEALPTGVPREEAVFIPDPIVTPPQPNYVAIDKSELLQVVNKKHNLPSSYVPSDLQTIEGHKLKGEVAEALRTMQSAASKDGHKLPIVSAYRSYGTQKDLYMQYVLKDGQTAADTYSARPGYSEHQTGMVVDLCSVEDSFATDPRAQWLAMNAHRYGFILRYPKGKESITGYQYEPWHFRYVGKDDAQKIYELNKTLEEYMGVEGGNYSDYIAQTPVEKPSDIDIENNSLLKQILAALTQLLAKITGIFK